jgi:hypothetical protein
MSRSNKTDLARSSKQLVQQVSDTEPGAPRANAAYEQTKLGGERFGNNRHMWAEAKVHERRGERKIANRDAVKEVQDMYVSVEPGSEGP